mgnify:CR=1 FL=1
MAAPDQQPAGDRAATAPAALLPWRALADEIAALGVELWTEAGWAWREAEGVEAPLYWERDGAGWALREAVAHTDSS